MCSRRRPTSPSVTVQLLRTSQASFSKLRSKCEVNARWLQKNCKRIDKRIFESINESIGSLLKINCRRILTAPSRASAAFLLDSTVQTSQRVKRASRHFRPQPQARSVPPCNVEIGSAESVRRAGICCGLLRPIVCKLDFSGQNQKTGAVPPQPVNRSSGAGIHVSRF